MGHGWVIPKTVRSLSVRSTWAGLGAQEGTPSPPPTRAQSMLAFPHRYPGEAQHNGSEEGWGRVSPEPTISESTVLGPSGRAVPKYCWLSQLVSGIALHQGSSVFPIALPAVFGDALRLSPNTVGSSDWFQEWLRIKAHRCS